MKTQAPESTSPLSEAAGGKVTVPMTEKHVAYLQSVGIAIFDEGTKPMPPELREIEANIRSQVESGMTGRYNPETHCVVEIAKERGAFGDIQARLVDALRQIDAQQAAVQEGYSFVRRYLQGSATSAAARRVMEVVERARFPWLSPSPETPEPE